MFVRLLIGVKKYTVSDPKDLKSYKAKTENLYIDILSMNVDRMNERKNDMDI